MARAVALVLLSAYLAAAGHLALEAHLTADTGMVVDAQPACAQPHGSSGIAHGHELQRPETECEVVALTRTAVRTMGTVTSVVSVSQVAVLVTSARPAVAPLAVLSVAPKASPPV